MAFDWSKAGKGAASGAVAGAASGMAAGPWGMLGGGLIGGTMGLLQGLNDPGDVPTAYQPDPGLFSYGGIVIDGNGVPHRVGAGNVVPTAGLETEAAQFGGVNPFIGGARGTQSEARQMLLNALAEGGPSVAEQMARAQAEEIGQQARSLAASGPYNPAAIRNAMNWQAGAHQRLLPQQIAGSLQEAQQQRQAKLQALLGLRGQDISQLGQEMGLEQARHGYGLGLQNVLTARYGLNAQDRQFGAQLAADYARLRAQQGNQQGAWQFAQNQQNQQNQINQNMGWMNAAASGMQTYLMQPQQPPQPQQQQGSGSSEGQLVNPWNPTKRGNDLIDPWSDVRAKKNIQGARPEAHAFLDALAQEGPRQYDYRAPFAGDNPYHAYGPMAQTLEQAGPIGASMVGQSGPEGMRYLKQPEVLKGLLTAVAEQQRQIQQLQQRQSPPAEMKGQSRRWMPGGGWEALPQGMSWADVDRLRAVQQSTPRLSGDWEGSLAGPPQPARAPTYPLYPLSFVK